VLSADDVSSAQATEADASWSDQTGKVIAIMTADCLPVLFSSTCGGIVAGAHAGWRGLASGVLEATVNELPCEPDQLIAWTGPCIGPKCFEVGEEVREQFVAGDPASGKRFERASDGKYLADLAGLATDRLSAVGVAQVFHSGLCTYSDAERFFSHRRDGDSTGRMVGLIWKV